MIVYSLIREYVTKTRGTEAKGPETGNGSQTSFRSVSDVRSLYKRGNAIAHREFERIRNAILDRRYTLTERTNGEM